MDRERLQLFWDHVRTFFLSTKSREALIFLFFLAVSAAFWLLQTLREEYELELQIPLSLKNVPAGVVVTSELPSVLTVTVKDRGSVLLNYFVDSDRRFAEVDFHAHDRGGSYEHIVLSHSETQKMLLPLLLPSSRIVSIRPDTLDYYYTRGTQKLVPVEFQGHLDVNPMCYLVGLKMVPDSVMVWGSEKELDSLKSVSTVMTNFSDLRETTELKVPLVTQRGTKVLPAEVMVRAEIDVYTEKQVRVPIVGTNFPGGYSLRTFPSSAEITFRVGTRDYKKITADNFVLTATYEDLKDLQDSVFTLQLRSVPEGVSQVRIRPETVQFLIEQTDIE